jgi:hypothetical protein
MWSQSGPWDRCMWVSGCTVARLPLYTPTLILRRMQQVGGFGFLLEGDLQDARRKIQQCLPNDVLRCYQECSNHHAASSSPSTWTAAAGKTRFPRSLDKLQGTHVMACKAMDVRTYNGRHGITLKSGKTPTEP